MPYGWCVCGAAACLQVQRTQLHSQWTPVQAWHALHAMAVWARWRLADTQVQGTQPTGVGAVTAFTVRMPACLPACVCVEEGGLEAGGAAILRPSLSLLRQVGCHHRPLPALLPTHTHSCARLHWPVVWSHSVCAALHDDDALQVVLACQLGASFHRLPLWQLSSLPLWLLRARVAPASLPPGYWHRYAAALGARVARCSSLDLLLALRGMEAFNHFPGWPTLAAIVKGLLVRAHARPHTTRHLHVP